MKLVEDDYIREQILKRLHDLEMSDADLLRDVEERGMPINQSRWSKYKTNKKGQITDEQLLFIATRLGIYISVCVGKPQIENGKIKFTVTPFNELEALTLLKKVFPDAK